MADNRTPDMNKNRNFVLFAEEWDRDNEIREETIELIVFRLGAEWYALDITAAREVLKVHSLRHVPSTPDHIAGIVNLRGNILSVSDLKKILGIPPEELTKTSRLIVIRQGTLETGLLVDEVAEIAEIPKNRIEPPLTALPSNQAAFLEGSCRLKHKLIAIINPEAIVQYHRKKI